MSSALSESDAPLTGSPFDSVRDYANALEARGRLLRIEAMDQDEYEITGLSVASSQGPWCSLLPGF